MNKLQRLCLATVLTLALTSATSAGEIHTPGFAQPSPSPTPASSTVAWGEIPLGESFSGPEVDDSESTSLTDVALNLLQIMLSVF
jgi:hypothetical protein